MGVATTPIMLLEIGLLDKEEKDGNRYEEKDKEEDRSVSLRFGTVGIRPTGCLATQ